MTDRRVAFVALAAAIVVVAAVVPALVSARPAREIPAPGVDGNLSGPDAPAWSEVPAADVPLSAAPSGLPDAKSVSASTVDVQAARSGGELYLRLQWADAEASANSDDPRAFLDAAAVQLPVNTSAQPAIAMGSRSNLVNVWYWRADQGVEELLAGGPGSTTHLGNSTLSTWSNHDNGTWTVVYNRDLRAGGPNRTAITDTSDLDVAFAVWNGSNMERSGRKAVSQWYYLPFGPEAGGAPFESILWAVAGLAAVVVALVTIQGFRRTRGESGGEPA